MIRLCVILIRTLSASGGDGYLLGVGRRPSEVLEPALGQDFEAEVGVARYTRRAAQPDVPFRGIRLSTRLSWTLSPTPSSCSWG